MQKISSKRENSINQVKQIDFEETLLANLIDEKRDGGKIIKFIIFVNIFQIISLPFSMGTLKDDIDFKTA